MKSRTSLAWILATALLVTSTAGLAQKGPSSRPQGNRQQPANVERDYDRDRVQGRDRVDQTDRQKDQEKGKSSDQVQQRDRDIYGYQLMTEQERNEYREQLKKAETNQERQQVIAEHRIEMQARARANGADLEESEEAE